MFFTRTRPPGIVEGALDDPYRDAVFVAIPVPRQRIQLGQVRAPNMAKHGRNPDPAKERRWRQMAERWQGRGQTLPEFGGLERPHAVGGNQRPFGEQFNSPTTTDSMPIVVAHNRRS